MIPSTFFLISSNLHQYPRRMLLHSPFFHHRVQPSTATPPSSPSAEHQTYTSVPPKHGGSNSIDANVIMIFSVLLCLLIFSICINCLIRCMFKCLIMITTNQERSLLRDNKEVISSGVDKRALKTFPVVKYSKDVKVQGLGNECVICLAEFKGGEKLRILPKCHHGFHAKCIDKWLGSQSSCPICRQSLVDTCQKIIGCDHDHQPTSSSSSSSSSSATVVICIAPLEREGLVRN